MFTDFGERGRERERAGDKEGVGADIGMRNISQLYIKMTY